MDVIVRAYMEEDLPRMREIWNEIVDEGIAFPQEEPLTEQGAREFFRGQTYTGVAVERETGEVLGLYILHPNNVGRCGHICNASYAVHRDMRGHKIGEALVRHCLQKAKELGFKILQFNAVVASNTPALNLYKKLGFVRLGTIPGGFFMKDGHYEDIVVHYIVL